MIGCAPSATIIISQVRHSVIEPVVINPNQAIPLDKVETAHGVTNVVATDVVVTGVAEIAHGATGVVVTDVVATEVVATKRLEKGIGNANPVEIATLHSGLSATDVDATKTDQEAMVAQAGHLEGTNPEVNVEH